MTILTKVFSEKKDILEVPLVKEDAHATAPPDVEAQNIRRVIIFPAQARRISPSFVFCLLIIALIGVSVGIIGGKILYNEYLSVTRKMNLREESSLGWVNIPLGIDEVDSDYDATVADDVSFKNNDVPKKWNGNDWQRILDRKFLQENYEINAVHEYEKIDVPDFRNGRPGRFIHDFTSNVTGIVDITGSRCFIMPLNRENVLPPTSLYDLLNKMLDGYYKVNTEVVRETMRVVTPPLSDTSEIGQYIADECENMPIYRLEKYVSGVVKRSTSLASEIKFGQFAGNGIMEFDIVNMDDVDAYEKSDKN